MRLLIKTEETVQSCGMMYKVVPQSVLMYRSESWVVTREMVKFLEGFHHRASRRITGMTVKRMADREW